MKQFEFTRSEKTEIFFESEENYLFKNEKIIIFVDSKLSAVFNNYLLEKYFRGADILKVQKVEVSESIKSLEYLEVVLKDIDDVDRNTILISIGGGALGDFVGFLASILLRGCRYVNFPSTLLAMVDSCFGGKTALNFSGVKNYIGSFKNPEKIVFDFYLLKSLSDEIYFDAFAEIIKYGCIYDPKILVNLMCAEKDFKRRDNNLLELIIRQSLKAKYSFVSNDLLDNDKRRILNFGHSFGHAIESISSYKITHGQAVAVGMIMAAQFSQKKGFCKMNVVNKITEIVSLFFDLKKLYKILSSFDVAKLASYMYNDKKKINNKLNLILIKDIGSCFVCQVKDQKEMESFLNNFIKNTKCFSHI